MICGLKVKTAPLSCFQGVKVKVIGWLAPPGMGEPAGRFMAACGGMGSIRISVWDPDSSGFSLHPGPPTCTSRCLLAPAHTQPAPHIYHSSRTTRTYVAHANRKTHRTELGVKVVFSDTLTWQTTAPSSQKPRVCFKLFHMARPLEEMTKNSPVLETKKPTRNISTVIGSLRANTHQMHQLTPRV